MSTSSPSHPSPAQLVERVPLIKNPAFWVPPPVEVPIDIHPLPEDVTAYFVYPHTLESHVLSTLPLQLSTLNQTQLQRLALLESMRESKERARKLKLQAIAPGWNESGEVMQPSRVPNKKEKEEAEEKELLMGEEEEGGKVESPKEMGEGTMSRMERDQAMDEWLDKWDGSIPQSHSTRDEGAVDDLI